MLSTYTQLTQSPLAARIVSKREAAERDRNDCRFYARLLASGLYWRNLR
jgi:hypothetical protein